MVLPSSDVNSSITCHGLGPRHVADTLAINACSDTGFQKMKPLALCDVDNYGAQYLHLRYGRQSAVPLASHNSLPPYTQSSVLAWWLTFDQAGLSSLLTSASLALLMFVSPIMEVGQMQRRIGAVLSWITHRQLLILAQLSRQSGLSLFCDRISNSSSKLNHSICLTAIPQDVDCLGGLMRLNAGLADGYEQ